MTGSPTALPSYQPRPFDESRWADVLALADKVVPYDIADNQDVIANRQRFAGTGRQRRHYAVLNSATVDLVGYGAIEQQEEPASYRVFIVPAADDLWGSVGSMLYDRLEQDALALRAKALWVREYEQDAALITFFSARGFKQLSVMVNLQAPGAVDVSSLRPLVHSLDMHKGRHRLVCPEDARRALNVAASLGFEPRFRYVILEKRLD